MSVGHPLISFIFPRKTINFVQQKPLFIENDLIDSQFLSFVCKVSCGTFIGVASAACSFAFVASLRPVFLLKLNGIMMG